MAVMGMRFNLLHGELSLELKAGCAAGDPPPSGFKLLHGELSLELVENDCAREDVQPFQSPSRRAVIGTRLCVTRLERIGEVSISFTESCHWNVVWNYFYSNDHKVSISFTESCHWNRY